MSTWQFKKRTTFPKWTELSDMLKEVFRNIVCSGSSRFTSPFSGYESFYSIPNTAIILRQIETSSIRTYLCRDMILGTFFWLKPAYTTPWADTFPHIAFP